MRALFALAVLAAAFGSGARAEPTDGAFKRCAACHLPTGAGVPGAIPPLTEHVGRIAATPVGRAYLVSVVAVGLSGPIEVDGQAYSGVMPAQRTLQDPEVAAALNHLISSWSKGVVPKDWRPFTAEEVASVRAAGAALHAGDVRALRERLPRSGGGK
jgi:hypothetical protein